MYIYVNNIKYYEIKNLILRIKDASYPRYLRGPPC